MWKSGVKEKDDRWISRFQTSENDFLSPCFVCIVMRWEAIKEKHIVVSEQS